uniref:Uncharacterized protein n=1 Tax=Anguilla anguilla TaxID=7936 RepID=A0A0E9SA81_ANGAN
MRELTLETTVFAMRSQGTCCLNPEQCMCLLMLICIRKHPGDPIKAMPPSAIHRSPWTYLCFICVVPKDTFSPQGMISQAIQKPQILCGQVLGLAALLWVFIDHYQSS